MNMMVKSEHAPFQRRGEVLRECLHKHGALGVSTVTETEIAHLSKVSDCITEKKIESVWSQN